MSGTKIRVRRSSLPIPLAERNWGGVVLGTVCATASIATWSFVVGGTSASYLGATMGAAAMLAGGLIGQLLVSLATVPVSTKHGIETVISTKPQLGVRGSYLALFLQYATVVGWNTVLMIFFGRSAASILEILGLIGPSAKTPVGTLMAGAGVVLVWWMISKGSRSLEKVGPIVAITISLMTVYLLYVLLRAYGAHAIFTAEPLAPASGRLLNYTSVIELLIVTTWGWWSYMGGMVRMVNSARKAILPSMLGLGVAWVLVAVVSLYSSLVTGEADPTVWAPRIAGNIGGIAVLLFVAFANLSSALVGTFVATLGFGQLPRVSNRVGWKALSAILLTPMLLVVLFFGNGFYDNVDQVMAFIGLLIAPMVGIQIADWFVLGRRYTLRVSALYQHDARSRYWYVAGVNPAGILAVIAGCVVYQLLLDPVTYAPRSALFPYVTASIPTVVISALVYVALSWVWRKAAGSPDGVADRPERAQR